MSQQLRMGILKLPDFWLSLVQIKDQGTIDDGRKHLCIAAHEGHLVVPDAIKRMLEVGCSNCPHFWRVRNLGKIESTLKIHQTFRLPSWNGLGQTGWKKNQVQTGCWFLGRLRICQK